MRRPALLLLTSVLVFTAGCTDLDSVAALGTASNDARAALTKVSDDFAGSCQRRAEILVRIPIDQRPTDQQGLTPNCQPFKQLSARLEAVQTVLTDYLDDLAKLASNQPLSYSANLTADLSTVSDLSPGPGASVTLAADSQKAATAALTIAQKIANIATRHYRQKHVRDLILETNPAVQQLTGALKTVAVTDYGSMLNSEKFYVDTYYQGPMSQPGADLTLPYLLVQRQYDTDLNTIQQHRETATAYAQVITRIGNLHAKLAEAAQRPSSFTETTKQLSPDIADLQDSVARLQKLQSKEK